MAEIKNLKKAASRILKAIKNKEKIILYGDADLDGVGSVIILKETIQNLGGEIAAFYFPDRETEGYGITLKGLNFLAPRFLKKSGPQAIIVALDLGIGNFKEIKLAKKLGFKVIVIDHHEVLDKLPGAEIIVDPKQPGDKYPFKVLAATALSFKLSESLLKEKLSGNLRQNFLELVALATLADMMPKEDENEIFIREGLSSIENSWRPGIRAFFTVDFLETWEVNLDQKISKIISILNIRDVENNFPAAYRLLNSESLEKSKEILSKLLEKSVLRKKKWK